jgi:polysaccharide deacetylase family protein (PEP-CTERM system associated)
MQTSSIQDPSHDASKRRVMNAMSVDVEDYFQVEAFANVVERSSWEDRECRIPRNIDRILGLFDAAGVRATFFTLGWVAERFPEVVRAILAGGHELASHGYRHVRADAQSPKEFLEDVTHTRKLLEDIGGAQVLGYRAASFSVGKRNLWALELLREAGYRYSSSINPIRHDLYGMPDAPRFPFYATAHSVLELPVTTVEIAGTRLPCGGGGYFRLLPYWLFRQGIKRVNAVDGQPTIFYFHPWEVDPEQPRIAAASLRSRVRHYMNLRLMERRLRRLIKDFPWGRIDQVFGLHARETDGGARRGPEAAHG